ncbi:hypothetical protein BV210_02490 [Halorientalis sp. IM1011]|uniref:hypothetical protein n=1 Tax=Halorientalis sp. IM1011 TaxID=1932360 RepID=UPI00097CC7CA|nr:hypothetical protein [Halorientalis sp. IM1011]AQL41650.1 hypothetical protein BV210_02490 [Halorientalis sp. IM1011]
MTPDPSDLDPGAAFELPGDTRLVIVGRCDDTPADDDSGPVYAAKVTKPDTVRTILNRPHNIEAALAGGATFDGYEAITERRDPFVCPGCNQPRRDSDEYSAAFLLDVRVCSYGCEQAVHQARRVNPHGD